MILDPFAGSGTTLVAAKELGCDYVGFEINKEYYETALRRLGQVDIKSRADTLDSFFGGEGNGVQTD